MTQFAYAVCSNPGSTAHASAAAVSALCALENHPAARVVVATDALTHATMRDRRHPLLSITEHLVEIPTRFNGSRFRSREIKIQMRNFIDGDYLFLDCDAFPVRRLSLDAPPTVDFAAVKELNYEPHLDEFFVQRGWRVDKANYFNSGVHFARDNERMRRMARQWFQRWTTYLDSTHKDQPALNATLVAENISTASLPSCWNRQGREEPMEPDVLVVHPYSWDDAPAAGTIFEPLIHEVEHGRLPGTRRLRRFVEKGLLSWEPRSARWQMRRGRMLHACWAAATTMARRSLEKACAARRSSPRLSFRNGK